MFERLIKGKPVEQEAQIILDNLGEKTYLTRNDQKRIEQAKKERRNLRNRRFKVGTALLVAVGLTTLVLTHSPNNEVSLPSWLTIQDKAQTDQTRSQAAIQAAIDWDNKYGCERNIAIQHTTQNEERIEPSGVRVRVLEQANPGLIELGPEGDARSIILHAMTHACVPNEPTRIQPIAYSEGFITGFHGAAMEVFLLETASTTFFRKIEEGIAERNAASFSGYKVVSDRAYFNVGNLALTDFPSSVATPVHQLVKRNDVPSIVRTILKLPPSIEVTPNHFETAMIRYQTAWDRGR